MEKETLRTAIFIVISYCVLWYVGAMFRFFPFFGDAVGFTGLMICLVIVGCTCWIIDEIKKK